MKTSKTRVRVDKRTDDQKYGNLFERWLKNYSFQLMTEAEGDKEILAIAKADIKDMEEHRPWLFKAFVAGLKTVPGYPR